MPQELLQNIAAEVQFFNTLEQKENFLFVLELLDLVNAFQETYNPTTEAEALAIVDAEFHEI
jgi:hypothetical protein